MGIERKWLRNRDVGTVGRRVEWDVSERCGGEGEKESESEREWCEN